MRARVCLAIFVVFVVAAFLEGSVPNAAPAAAGGQSATSLDDQIELSVTVYNSDIALVRDVRNLQLPPGTFDLRFMDIAATINPATVHFRSLTEPQRVRVLEQNYEYDLLEPDKLLRKYVGRDVTLVRSVQDAGSTRQQEVRARLLSFNEAPVWQIGDEIVTGLHADHIRFPQLPDNLYSRPTLIWSLDNGGATRHRVEASYLAGKLSWNADYVLTVSRDDKSADLDGWVTLANASGTAFRNARVQLVAGDLNRVRQLMADALRKTRDERAVAAQAPMEQEAFSEYHLYTIGHKTSVNNNETKQVSMLTGTGIPVEKRYIVDGQSFYYRNPQHPAPRSRTSCRCITNSRTRRRLGLACRCRPVSSGCIKPTRRAECSSPVKITSGTRRKTRR
jgi:hypothetical protein